MDVVEEVLDSTLDLGPGCSVLVSSPRGTRTAATLNPGEELRMKCQNTTRINLATDSIMLNLARNLP